MIPREGVALLGAVLHWGYREIMEMPAVEAAEYIKIAEEMRQ